MLQHKLRFYKQVLQVCRFLTEFTYTIHTTFIFTQYIIIRFLLQIETCSCLWGGVQTKKFNVSDFNKEGSIYSIWCKLFVFCLGELRSQGKSVTVS